MPHFNAKPHEVRAMLGCDEFCIVRPLKPQPSVGFTVSRYAGEHTVEFDCDPPICAPEYIPLLFSPGDVVTVREAHAFDAECIRILYAATDDIQDRRRVRSSAVMRNDQSRLTLTVESVSVKRVQEVTEEEARLACGGNIVLAMTWDDHHPKTPWSDNPWVCVARAKVHHCNVAKVTSEEAA